MVISTEYQYIIVSGVIIFIAVIILLRLRKTKFKSPSASNNGNREAKTILSIIKQHELKNYPDGIGLTRFVPKAEMEEIKSQLLPYKYVWSEEKEKFIIASNLDEESLIQVFDLFDTRIVKLEDAVYGKKYNDPDVRLPMDFTPLLERLDRLENKIERLLNPVSVNSPKTVTKSQDPAPKAEDKKIEIDLAYFSEPRTTEDIVEHFKLTTKQGLYMKLTALGVKRNADGNYYTAESVNSQDKA